MVVLHMLSNVQSRPVKGRSHYLFDLRCHSFSRNAYRANALLHHYAYLLPGKILTTVQ